MHPRDFFNGMNRLYIPRLLLYGELIDGGIIVFLAGIQHDVVKRSVVNCIGGLLRFQAEQRLEILRIATL